MPPELARLDAEMTLFVFFAEVRDWCRWPTRLLPDVVFEAVNQTLHLVFLLSFLLHTLPWASTQRLSVDKTEVRKQSCAGVDFVELVWHYGDLVLANEDVRKVSLASLGCLDCDRSTHCDTRSSIASCFDEA